MPPLGEVLISVMRDLESLLSISVPGLPGQEEPTEFSLPILTLSPVMPQ